MDKKYLHLTTDCESNIAVIGCDSKGEFLTDQVQAALSDHFDLDIQVNSIEELSKTPMKLIVKYSYTDTDNDGDLVMLNAELNQTWLY